MKIEIRLTRADPATHVKTECSTWSLWYTEREIGCGGQWIDNDLSMILRRRINVLIVGGMGINQIKKWLTRHLDVLLL